MKAVLPLQLEWPKRAPSVEADDVGQLTRSRHWHCSYKDLLVVWTGKLPCAVWLGCCPYLLWLHCYDILFLDGKGASPAQRLFYHFVVFLAAEKLATERPIEWPLFVVHSGPECNWARSSLFSSNRISRNVLGQKLPS